MKHSLITKITIIFVIAFGLICLLFVTFGRMQINQAIDRMQASQINSINYLLNLFERSAPPQDMEDYFKNFNLELVKDKNLITNVIASGTVLFRQKTPIGEFISVRYQNSLFLHIINESFRVTFESAGAKNLNDPLWIGFFLALALLISLYLSMLNSLAPLKQLNRNIKKFAAGNMDVICLHKKGDDEIGQLALEFDNAVCKIRELVRSRQLFLRTIMHELKTPIGKGRIVSEMVEDHTQKKRLINIFERLDILINEFAKVEQLLSKNYSLNYQECHFSLILEQVRDLLMLDNWKEKVEVSIVKDAVINVDFQLFSLAIKNLIDNALKYSDDRKVKVLCNKDQICVMNKSKPLPVSIEHYKQAFTRNKDEKTTGMGLGLYIIDKICEMHKFKLNYNYVDGNHHFCIIFDRPAREILNSKKEKRI